MSVEHKHAEPYAYTPVPDVEPVGRHELAGAPATTWEQYVTITERALADRWRMLLGWSLGLIGISAVQLAVYPSIKTSATDWQSMLDAWPKAFQEMFNIEAYTTGPGFLNAELFSMMFPLILTAVALGFASGATAGEEERGTADVLLALPVTRAGVLAAKATAMVLGVLVVAAAGVGGLLVGAPLAGLDVGAAGIVVAGLMTALLALAFGSIGLLVGALTGRRATVIGVGMSVAIGAFLLNALAPMADWLEPWQKVSPFYWTLHTDALTEGLNGSMALLLLATAALAVGAAVRIYARHDLHSR